MRILLCSAFGIFLLSACSGTNAVTEANAGKSVVKPRFFIAETLGSSCTVDERGAGRNQASVGAALQRLYSNNTKYISDLRSSTSLTVNKDAYAANWTLVLFNSYAAAAADDEALARTIISGIKNLARGQRYLREPGLLTQSQARSRPACYSQGPNTPCPTHTPRFVSRMYSNLLISAAVLDPYLTERDRAAIMPWFDQGYQRFVAPELNANQGGIYDFANMGLARLAYAALKNDMGMARRELSARRNDFLRRIEPSGYIDENSFRGVRGFWYHTYGLDSALSYALVAREWGVDYFSDPALRSRLVSAVEKTDLGIRDHAAFRTAGNRGSALSTEADDTRDFVHQYALNIYQIAAREFGVRLPPSPQHQRLSRSERYSQISGLSARCYYSGR